MTNLASILTDSAGRYAGRPAVRLDDVVLTYAELDEQSAHAAGWLRARGVEPGDRVGIMLPNVVEFPVLYYAVLRRRIEGGSFHRCARRFGQGGTRFCRSLELASSAGSTPFGLADDE